MATILEPRVYCADSTNSITLADGANYRLEYLLGLLNSDLFQWRFKITSTNNNVSTTELDAMPFRAIDFADAADRARHDRMVGLVERMMQLQNQFARAKTPAEKTAVRRQRQATDRQIEQLMHELYGLNGDDISVIEGSYLLKQAVSGEAEEEGAAAAS